MIRPEERLLVALDVPDRDRAVELTGRLEGSGCGFKVGLELLYAAGPDLISFLAGKGLRVFADAKLHDIPRTVYGGARALSQRGCWMISVHIGAGEAVAAAALEGAREGAPISAAPRPRVIGITVLTSFDEASFQATAGTRRSLNEEVLRRAELAKRWGLDGVVCSPHEAAEVRRVLGGDALIVTPGVRTRAEADEDQRRVGTAAGSIRAGADYLVVGRPVHRAADPAAALRLFAEEVSSVHGDR